MIRTYKCRVKLSSAGHEALTKVFGMCATLYNACLESWIDCYKKTRKSRSYYDQCKELTEVRADDPEYAGISVQVFRGVVGRIDKAYKSFFRNYVLDKLGLYIVFLCVVAVSLFDNLKRLIA